MTASLDLPPTPDGADPVIVPGWREKSRLDQ